MTANIRRRYSGGARAGDLPVGAVVLLTVDGVPTEHIVVQQGIPPGDVTYDATADGTWLMLAQPSETKSNFSGNASYDYSSRYSQTAQAAMILATLPGVSSRGRTIIPSARELGAAVFDSGSIRYYTADGNLLAWFDAEYETVLERLARTESYWTRTKYLNSSTNFWYICNSVQGTVSGQTKGSGTYYYMRWLTIIDPETVVAQNADGTYSLD